MSAIATVNRDSSHFLIATVATIQCQIQGEVYCTIAIEESCGRDVKEPFSIEQITVVLQEAAQAFQGGDLCREIGISEQNLYRWKNVYCELQPIEERELKLAAHRSYEAEPPPDPDHSPITAVSTSTDNSARNSEERLRRSGTFIDTPLNDDQRRHLAGQILGRGLMGPSLAW